MDLERATIYFNVDEEDIDGLTSVFLSVEIEIPGDYTPQDESAIAAHWRKFVETRFAGDEIVASLWNDDSTPAMFECAIDGSQWVLPPMREVVDTLGEEAWEWRSPRRQTRLKPGAPARWVLDLVLPLQAVSEQT